MNINCFIAFDLRNAGGKNAGEQNKKIEVVVTDLNRNVYMRAGFDSSYASIWKDTSLKYPLGEHVNHFNFIQWLRLIVRNTKSAVQPGDEQLSIVISHYTISLVDGNLQQVGKNEVFTGHDVLKRVRSRLSGQSKPSPAQPKQIAVRRQSKPLQRVASNLTPQEIMIVGDLPI
jgi:hypothetical protein